MMSREEILNKISEIIREEFEDDSIVISEETVAKDIEGWDSLAHLSILHEIEESFNVKFTMAEVQGFKNIGEIINSVSSKI